MAEQDGGDSRRKMSDWVVLRLERTPGEGHRKWVEFPDEQPTARSRRDAIAKATADLPDKTGEFVAVPRSEWKPMSRKVETKQVETWE